MKRFWFYALDDWDGPWFYKGNDEYGRHTFVMRVPFRFLVLAYKTCHDEFCVAVREQTAELEREMIAAGVCQECDHSNYWHEKSCDDCLECNPLT